MVRTSLYATAMVLLVPIQRMQALRKRSTWTTSDLVAMHHKAKLTARTVRDIRGARRDDVLKGRILHVDV